MVANAKRKAATTNTDCDCEHDKGQLVDEVTGLEDVAAGSPSWCANEYKNDTKPRMGWSAQLL
ncbi:hypothetical protein PILCRDRAFT_812188 [Piloderma croceum F 1598]|uniref:Uncharacterized protein n=1 Tax=Piloderma croceum (strain F 1598) TaxID=765440 RepID=A0A0C3BV61_PILCF|nr:hypothetical protein PILCRDRAFT_812188 [Piloderma croceum F 1598]